MRIQEHNAHAVIYPTGYLNGPLGKELDATCSDLMRRGKQGIIINFSDIETINTMGIANLVQVLEKVGNRQGHVCFTDLPPANRQMLDVLDISRAVLIFEHEEEALRHFTGV